jgi:hypothetical protein
MPLDLAGLVGRRVRSDRSFVVSCLWTPAEYANLKLWEVIQAGLWQRLPIRYGYSTLKCLLELMDKMESARGKPRDRKSHTEDMDIT